MTLIPSITVSDVALDRLETPLLVIAVPKEGTEVVGELSAVDAATNGALGRAMTRRDFRGARDETLLLGGADSGIQRVLLVGIGGSPAGGTAAADRILQVRRASMIAAGSGARRSARSSTSTPPAAAIGGSSSGRS